MKQYIKNLFSKPEAKEDNIVTLENKCECGGQICYDKNSLLPLDTLNLHSEADAFCKECGNDKFRVRVSAGMTSVYHK